MPSSKREREAARRRYERRQAQRQYKRSRARRRNAVIAAVLATVLVIAGVVALAVGLSGSGKKSTVTAASTPRPSASSNLCSYEPVPKTQPNSIKNVGLPDTTPDRKTPYVATIKTNVGTIKVDLLTSKAPCTVNSFRFLASNKYFDGTPCHRLTTSGIYVLQCGDPSGTGSGGPGYQFDDENLTGATYPAGTVAMANAGPGTNGSQFFLVYKDTQLPPNYTPFGKIVGGLDVVQKVAKAGDDNAFASGGGGGHPKMKVTIQSFTVQPA